MTIGGQSGARGGVPTIDQLAAADREIRRRSFAELPAGPLTIHRLKTWPVEFAASESGDKPFEVRVADRPYARGDMVALVEWAPDGAGGGADTGRIGWRLITYVMAGGAWGLPPHLCVLGLAPVADASVPEHVEVRIRDEIARERRSAAPAAPRAP